MDLDSILNQIESLCSSELSKSSSEDYNGDRSLTDSCSVDDMLTKIETLPPVTALHMTNLVLNRLCSNHNKFNYYLTSLVDSLSVSLGDLNSQVSDLNLQLLAAREESKDSKDNIKKLKAPKISTFDADTQTSLDVALSPAAAFDLGAMRSCVSSVDKYSLELTDNVFESNESLINRLEDQVFMLKSRNTLLRENEAKSRKEVEMGNIKFEEHSNVLQQRIYVLEQELKQSSSDYKSRISLLESNLVHAREKESALVADTPVLQCASIQEELPSILLTSYNVDDYNEPSRISPPIDSELIACNEKLAATSILVTTLSSELSICKSRIRELETLNTLLETARDSEVNVSGVSSPMNAIEMLDSSTTTTPSSDEVSVDLEMQKKFTSLESQLSSIRAELASSKDLINKLESEKSSLMTDLALSKNSKIIDFENEKQRNRAELRSPGLGLDNLYLNELPSKGLLDDLRKNALLTREIEEQVTVSNENRCFEPETSHDQKVLEEIAKLKRQLEEETEVTRKAFRDLEGLKAKEQQYLLLIEKYEAELFGKTKEAGPEIVITGLKDKLLLLKESAKQLDSRQNLWSAQLEKGLQEKFDKLSSLETILTSFRSHLMPSPKSENETIDKSTFKDISDQHEEDFQQLQLSRSELAMTRAHNMSLQSELSSVGSALFMSKTEVLELERKLSTCQSEFASNIRLSSILSMDLDDKVAAIASMTSRLGTVEAEKAVIAKHLESALVHNQTLMTENCDMKLQYERKIVDLESSKIEMNFSKAYLNNTVSSLEAEQRELRLQLVQKGDTVKCLDAALKNQRTEHAEALKQRELKEEDRMFTLKKKYESAVSELEVTNQAFVVDLEIFKSKYKDLSESTHREIQNSRTILSELSSDYNNVKHKLETSNLECRRLVDVVKKLEGDILTERQESRYQVESLSWRANDEISSLKRIIDARETLQLSLIEKLGDLESKIGSFELAVAASASRVCNGELLMSPVRINRTFIASPIDLNFSSSLNKNSNSDSAPLSSSSSSSSSNCINNSYFSSVGNTGNVDSLNHFISIENMFGHTGGHTAHGEPSSSYTTPFASPSPPPPLPTAIDTISCGDGGIPDRLSSQNLFPSTQLSPPFNPGGLTFPGLGFEYAIMRRNSDSEAAETIKIPTVSPFNSQLSSASSGLNFPSSSFSSSSSSLSSPLSTQSVALPPMASLAMSVSHVDTNSSYLNGQPPFLKSFNSFSDLDSFVHGSPKGKTSNQVKNGNNLNFSHVPV